jgi:hypothetical protein
MTKATFVPDTQSRNPQQPFVLSYLGMRRFAGWVGVSLPFAVALGNWLHTRAFEGSISAYYFTRMGAWFVGSLWVIGFFMGGCRGYDKWDELSGRLAGIFALCVALIPMNICNVKQGLVYYRGWLHWICAALLFIVLALMSLLLFTRSDSGPPAGKKATRNLYYKVCGCIMLAAVALIGVINIVPTLADRLANFKPVFLLEAVAVISFGISWLVKGETFRFLRD